MRVHIIPTKQKTRKQILQNTHISTKRVKISTHKPKIPKPQIPKPIFEKTKNKNKGKI